MTGSMRSSDGLDPRRKRLLYQAWHRGTKEMDIVMGHFANHWIDRLSEVELDQFERLIDEPDADIFGWITGREPIPAPHDNGVFIKLKALHGLPGENWPGGSSA